MRLPKIKKLKNHHRRLSTPEEGTKAADCEQMT
jgi:hypothetical protein